MTVTVYYCAQIKQAVGMAEEKVEVGANCTAQGLIKILADDHGEPLRNFLLDDDGALRMNNLLVVGDEQVPWNVPRVLEDGDRVTLLPPISGGCGTE